MSPPAAVAWEERPEYTVAPRIPRTAAGVEGRADVALLEAAGIEIGEATLAEVGGVAGLLGDPARAAGLTPAVRGRCEAVAELCRRRAEDTIPRTGAIVSVGQAQRWFEARLSQRRTEQVLILYLTLRHEPITAETLSEGGLEGASLQPREVVRRCLIHEAAAVIVGHSHPSGDPTPSAQDRAVTRQLAQALALIDVRLLDHVVVGGRSSRSLKEYGWLEEGAP